MPRLYLRLMLIPLLGFTVALLFIRIQPYDDYELRELLLPEGCPMPCFIGIRPGITTAEEAVQILQDSGWVDHLTGGNVLISWTWNGKQPAFIDQTQPPWVTSVRAVDGHLVVNEIILSTHIATGWFMLAMPKPQSFMVTSGLAGLGKKRNFVSLRYSDLFIQGVLFCPAHIHDLMHQPASLTLYNPNNAPFDFEQQFWDNGPLVSFATDSLLCRS